MAEDVAFGPRNLGLADERVDSLGAHALAKVGMPLEEFGPRQPLSLSGGERRRVALAGVLAMDPEVLVLDEPTAGLDPQTTASLCKLFAELSNQGRTLVLISHDMELVSRLATHVVVLRQGRVELQGADPHRARPSRIRVCQRAGAPDVHAVGSPPATTRHSSSWRPIDPRRNHRLAHPTRRPLACLNFLPTCSSAKDASSIRPTAPML